MGNSVSARRWTDLWFNEGWATFSEVYWGSKVNSSKQTPREFFRAVIKSRPENFELAPAVLDGDPANLFDGFAVYERTGAMFEGFRQIIGDKRFFAFARELAEASVRTISRGAFVARRAASGLGRAAKAPRRLLPPVAAARGQAEPAALRLPLDARRYFQQWLRADSKPTITPDSFTPAP